MPQWTLWNCPSEMCIFLLCYSNKYLGSYIFDICMGEEKEE